MLTKDQLEIADKNVQLFYSELAKTPYNFNGNSPRETRFLNDGFFQLYTLEETLKKLPENATHQERISALSKKQNQVLASWQEEAAKVAGISELGVNRLITRVPIIFYYLMEQDEKSSFAYACSPVGVYAKEKKVLVERTYEIGLCPEVLKTFNWSHGKHKGFYIGPDMSKNTETFVPFEISKSIEKKLSQKIQCLFNGLLYYGLDKTETEKLFCFVDTSEGSTIIEGNKKIAERCTEVKEKYGIDALFTLYATKSIKLPEWWKENVLVSDKVRFEPSDKKYVNLQMHKIEEVLAKIEQKYDSETFWRLLVQYYFSKGKLTSFDYDPEQSMRDLLREHLLPSVE